jgi:excisionase family DNA binding protein
MKKNFTIKRTAELLGVSLKTVYRMIIDGDVIAFKCRGCLRITEESLDQYRTRQIIAYQESNGISEK